MNKIALGTAQLGSDYGITNKDPDLGIENSKRIIEYAKKRGVDTLDTAMDYAFESQSNSFKLSDFKINTKLPKVPENIKNIPYWIEQKVEQSLENLSITEINSLLLHNPEQLFKNKGEQIWKTLNYLKQKKLVKKIGISIYDPKKVEKIFLSFQPDVIQTPFNIIDRRIIKSSWLKKAKKNGIEIQVRSIFLQGLLLLDENDLPIEFKKWKYLWREMNVFLERKNYTKLQLLISFVLSFKDIDTVIVGVDNLSQLKEILNSEFQNIKLFPDVSSNDKKLINPLNWSLYRKNKKEFFEI